MKTSTVLMGTAAAGAVGYALADLLARAGSYAERVEEREFCGPPSAAVPASRRPEHSHPAAAAVGMPADSRPRGG